MWWNREKRVKVELVNPEIWLKMPREEKPCTPAQPESDSETNMQAITMVAKLALALQGLLLVFGYSALAGRYEQYGIQMDELEVSTPALMLQGYVYIITDILMPLGSFPAALLLLASIIFITASTTRAFWKQKSDRWQTRHFLSTTLAGIVMFFLPALGIRVGVKEASRSLSIAGIHTDNSISPTHIIDIPKRGKTTGPLIAATPRYTFLLADNEVLKIANDSREIVRVMRFDSHDQTKSMQLTTPMPNRKEK